MKSNKSINIDTIDELIKLKESFVNTITKKINEKEINKRIESINSLNIGGLKALFEGVSLNLYNLDNISLISKYAKVIKENKSLLNTYRLYESCNKYHENPELWIKNAFEIVDKCNKNKLNEGLDKLRNIIKKCVKESQISYSEFDKIIEENKNTINENFDYIVSNKKSFNNLDDYTKNMLAIVESINKSNNILKENIENIENVNVKNINNILSEATNDWVKDLAKKVALFEMEGKELTDLFEEYKNECISIINESIDNDNCDIELSTRLLGIKQHLDEKQYNKEIIYDDLVNLAELKENLK